MRIIVIVVVIVRYPNLSKFPFGLKELARQVNEAGCKFGLWFEPEMISEDSVVIIFVVVHIVIIRL